MIARSGAVRRVFDGDAVGWLAAPALLLVVQQIVWPAPAGALLDGVILGLITSLVALGIVLIHRSNRVLNFAQGELGLLPTTLAVMLVVESGFPYLAALVLGLLLALTTGAAAEFVVVRRFFHSPRLILTIATLGLAQLLGFAERVGVGAGVGASTATGPMGRLDTAAGALMLDEAVDDFERVARRAQLAGGGDGGEIGEQGVAGGVEVAGADGGVGREAFRPSADGAWMEGAAVLFEQALEA